MNVPSAPLLAKHVLNWPAASALQIAGISQAHCIAETAG
jgi:hypothetical protein